MKMRSINGRNTSRNTSDFEPLLSRVFPPPPMRITSERVLLNRRLNVECCLILQIKNNDQHSNIMRVLFHLLLSFNLRNQQPHQLPVSSSTSLNLFQTKKAISVQRDEKIQDLLQFVFNVGQVGSLASEEERTKLEELSKAAIPLSESKPAKFPLAGEHKLLYSAAPGVSSGRIFGNVVGKVTQFFEDDEIFYNRVSFGPLRIALKAKREIKDDSTIQVSFLETKVSLFGKTLAQKNAGGGKYCL
jgi:hypothetical protein